MVKNIVIVGGGFAGTSALKLLSRKRKTLGREFRLVLVDSKKYFEFLPMLPDIIGERINGDSLRVDLGDLCSSLGCDFSEMEVTGIDVENNCVYAGDVKIDYEYLILSSGSETNFFGNGLLKKNCYKLDNVDDAIKIREGLLERSKSGQPLNLIVIGGGYTGIEIATNVYHLFRKQKLECKITILEKGPDILMMVPEWLRKECRVELERIGIEIRTGDSLADHNGQAAVFGSGARLENAFCIWSAGVRTPAFLESLPGEREKSRINVDEYLRISGSPGDKVFVAGDNASFFCGNAGGSLRMAVMFSMGQGKTAAKNVINSLIGVKLGKYRAVDLGYLIPIATGIAPGIIMNKRVNGKLGYFLHYFMCIYRAEWANKFKILKYCLKGGKSGKRQIR